jgi:hypothetical protein
MGAAPVIIIRRERDVVASYRGAGATSPETARSPEELDLSHRLAFDRLVRRAVLRDAGGGRYYLDEASWKATNGMRRRFIIIALAILLVMFAILISSGVIAINTGIPKLH